MHVIEIRGIVRKETTKSDGAFDKQRTTERAKNTNTQERLGFFCDSFFVSFFAVSFAFRLPRTSLGNRTVFNRMPCKCKQQARPFYAHVTEHGEMNGRWEECTAEITRLLIVPRRRNKRRRQMGGDETDMQTCSARNAGLACEVSPSGASLGRVRSHLGKRR